MAGWADVFVTWGPDRRAPHWGDGTIKISHFSYGRGKEGNGVVIGDLTIWFSYSTPVAFSAPGFGTYARQNDWGPTTGRHLNEIDGGDKSSRLPGPEFYSLLERAVAQIGNSGPGPPADTSEDRARPDLLGKTDTELAA